MEAHARHFGHLCWVRSVAVEPGNKWFATGAGDHIIKIWNLVPDELRLSVTGHNSTVNGLVVSFCRLYLFSCGEVIWPYRGPLSGFYSSSVISISCRLPHPYLYPYPYP
jgi:pleiotropic regulator 1